MVQKRIGILGGTFNPIHNGHLEIAKRALKEFKLDKVVFMPTGLPPHKGTEDLLEKGHRLRMIKRAIRGSRRFSLSRIEIDRPGYSYAVDTFRRLKIKLGKNADLFYIMGLDSVNDLLTWRKPLELLKMCEFIVATRPESKMRIFKRLMKFPPLTPYAKKIHLLEMKIEISSTNIRRRLREGQSIKGLVPQAVERYIKEQKLYH